MISECSAIATFLAGRKLSRIGMLSDRSSISTVDDRVVCSVRSISKSSGDSRTGVPGAVAADRVADRALQVEVERIAVLVLLGLVGALVPLAEPVHLVLADLVLGELVEQVAQRVRTDLAQPLRRQLEAAFLLLDQAGVLQHLGQLGQPLERAGRVVAHQVADAVHVGLGQRAGAGGVAQQVLELVEVAELLHRLHRLAHAHRVLALEVVALVPAHLREHRLQVLAELIHLPAQVHVLQQLIAELLQLRPLLGRHRVEHRLHRRHPLGHLLEQLVEVLRVLREEVAELLHELLELRVLAALAAARSSR